jgi:hypothetical protein
VLQFNAASDDLTVGAVYTEYCPSYEQDNRLMTFKDMGKYQLA